MRRGEEPDSRRGVQELRDGRRLAWAVTGPDDGVPVLFIAGAGLGHSMTFGGDALTERGVALITVDRPGMGESTHDPSRSLDSTAQDLGELVGEWRRPLPVVANSQGAPFALALALAGHVSRLVLVSPADEVAVEPVLSMLPDPQRAVVDGVRRDPEAARGFLSGLGADGMEAMVVGGADDADRAVYTHPAFLARYRAALAEGFANGGVGYVADTMLAMSPWGLDLARVPCEVSLWMGERDRHHSPDGAATLASRIRGCRRTVVPDAGGALLWTHADAVLADALAPG